jgi:hypothetical protein
MNSQHPPTPRAARNLRATTIALFGAIGLLTMTGCFGSPRANDTIAGAAIGAGAGALLTGPESSPATGALIGGLAGGTVGYIVGSETENRWDYGPYGGYYGRPYYGGF